MLSLKDSDGTPIKKGYYNKKPGYRLVYIHKRKDSWHAQSTDDGLVHLTSVTSKHYQKCHDQEKAAKNFEEERIARKNNLENFLKN